MDDRSSDDIFTFTVSIPIPEAHGRYRANLQRYFGLMVRAILLTKEGHDFREAIPPDRLKVDINAQAMRFMFDSTFDLLQSLGLLVALRNQLGHLTLDESTAGGVKVILSGYEHDRFILVPFYDGPEPSNPWGT